LPSIAFITVFPHARTVHENCPATAEVSTG
jgi:hypothetical protein